MDCLELYKEIKAEGQVKNFYNSYNNILMSDVQDLSDVRQSIMLVLAEYIKNTKISYKKNPDLFLKTANVVVQNNLKDILNEVAQEKARDIAEIAPDKYLESLVEKCVIVPNTDEYEIARLRFVDELSYMNIANRLNRRERLKDCREEQRITWNKNKVYTVVHSILVQSQRVFYVSKYVGFSDLLGAHKDDSGDEVQSCIDAGLISVDDKEESAEYLWKTIEKILDKQSLKIIQYVIVDQKSFVEISKTLKLTPEGVKWIYDKAIATLRRKLKNIT